MSSTTPPGADRADTEFVRLRNVSDQRVELDGYQLRNITVAHEFEPNTYLDPGEVLRVTVGTGTPSRTQQYWGQAGPILRNDGDRVDVVSFDERFVDCVDWGSGRSCPWPVTVPGAGTSGALPTDVELALPRFTDVAPTSTHATSIAWLVEQGITGGCTPERYCPSEPVTRAQMATFLTAALGGANQPNP